LHALVGLGAARADDVAIPKFSTDSPGFGNRRSVLSTVLQPGPILATNISGRALKAAMSRSANWVAFRVSRSLSRLDEPPVRVTGAQFMYISRLPILLNQVHASVASPVGRLVGIVKL
jgi:hypothetical protein